MAVAIDRMTRRDLAARNQAVPQGGLNIQAVLHRDSLEEAVLRGWRREKGEPGEQAEVSAADRIDSPDASSVSKDGLEDEAQGKALRWEAYPLGRSQRRREVGGAKLEQIRDEEEAASAGGSEPAFEEGGHVMLDVVTGDDEWARLARVMRTSVSSVARSRAGSGSGVTRFFSTDRSRRAPVRRV